MGRGRGQGWRVWRAGGVRGLACVLIPGLQLTCRVPDDTRVSVAVGAFRDVRRRSHVVVVAPAALDRQVAHHVVLHFVRVRASAVFDDETLAKDSAVDNGAGRWVKAVEED